MPLPMPVTAELMRQIVLRAAQERRRKQYEATGQLQDSLPPVTIDAPAPVKAPLFSDIRLAQMGNSGAPQDATAVRPPKLPIQPTRTVGPQTLSGDALQRMEAESHPSLVQRGTRALAANLRELGEPAPKPGTPEANDMALNLILDMTGGGDGRVGEEIGNVIKQGLHVLPPVKKGGRAQVMLGELSAFKTKNITEAKRIHSLLSEMDGWDRPVAEVTHDAPFLRNVLKTMNDAGYIAHEGMFVKASEVPTHLGGTKAAAVRPASPVSYMHGKAPPVIEAATVPPPLTVPPRSPEIARIEAQIGPETAKLAERVAPRTEPAVRDLARQDIGLPPVEPPPPIATGGEPPVPPEPPIPPATGGGEPPIPPPRNPARAINETASQLKSRSVIDALRKTFAPATRSPQAAQTGRIIRANTGKLAYDTQLASKSLEDFSGAFDALPEQHNLDFIYKMEGGKPQATSDLTGASTAIRGMLDTTRDKVIALGTGKLEHFIQDYFPHIWEKPEEVGSVIGRVLGKRPLEGPKSFLKSRTIPTTEEGIALGFKPITYNPVKLALLKNYEMNRYLMGQNILKEMKDNSLVKFVKATERAPDGYVAINDRIATVSGPLTEEGARTLRGAYHAPEPVATVLNNYLSPGLRGHVLYDAYMHMGNTLNQAQLGFSAFHLGFTSLDAAISKTALGIEQLASGQVGAAVKSFATVPVAPVTTYLQGSKVLREAFKPGSQGGDFADIVKGVVDGGGRFGQDNFYKNNSIEAFQRALREHRPVGVVGHALPAFLELSSKPLMEHVVPRQKLGVFADLFRHELTKLGPDATTDEVRKAAQGVWDSVDNRMGQLVYDNLFWHKTLKDLSMASVRSVGWNVGDFRELGGGAIDLMLGGPLTHKGAYVLALPITVGMAGATLNYLYTGEGPKELKDYFYPRTGRQNENGDEERVQLPSYVKDIVGYGRDFPTGAYTTLKHKLNPALGAVAEMLSNEDFYGDQIRNKNDPTVKQMMQEAEYIANIFTPLGVRNIREARKRDQPLDVAAGSFFGITPAPRQMVRTDAGNAIAEYTKQHMPKGRTPEDVDKSDLRREIMQSARSGEAAPDALREKAKKAIARGEFHKKDLARALKDAQTPPSLAGFKRLPVDEAMRIYKMGTPREQQLWKSALGSKLKRALGDSPEMNQ